MSILGSILMGANLMTNGEIKPCQCNLVPYGKSRQDGGHDHRYNRGRDRTPAQRKADSNRAK